MSEGMTTIDTNQLGDEGTHIVRVFVSDYYDETEELELVVSRDGVSFRFFFEGDPVGERTLSHEELYMLLVEKQVGLLSI